MKKPVVKKHTTIRLPEALIEQFDACAARRGVSRNLLIEQLMAKFVREDRRKTVEGVL